jgi:hypothetical protein
LRHPGPAGRGDFGDHVRESIDFQNRRGAGP